MRTTHDSAQTEAPTPDWTALHALAAGQEGLLSAKQAAEVGFSLQLLQHHIGAGRLIRLRRGIYRLAYWPTGDHEDLVEAVLWSEGEAVISHTTALAAYDLSDALPSKVYITVPMAWVRRRLKVPQGLVLHYGEVPAKDRGWLGPVQITKPARTLNDCARAALSPELLQQATRQALQRGLVRSRDVAEVRAALKAYQA